MKAKLRAQAEKPHPPQGHARQAVDRPGQGQQPDQVHKQRFCAAPGRACLWRANQRHGRHLGAHDWSGLGQSQDRHEEPRVHHAPPRPTGSPQPKPGVTNGRTGPKIALRIAENGPEPKVRAAKWAAHHQTQGNTRSTDGRCRSSGGTCYPVAAKTVKNRRAHR